MDFTTNESPCELGQLRFSHINDEYVVQELIDKYVNKNVFHEPNIHALIEMSFLSVCQLDTDDQVVGYLALQTYPNIKSIHPSAWEEYIWTRYKDINMRAHNTLFVHMFCWDPQYSTTIVSKMLKSVFFFNAYIYHIVIVMPPGYKTIQEGYDMDRIFSKSTGFVKGVKSIDLGYLYIATRANINPRLRIRKAVAEDNDELVHIINKQSTRLKDMYGEYYISELIERHPESDRMLLVAEMSGLIIGVMCLSTTIDYNLLNDSFHLEPFWGLHKQTNYEAEKLRQSEIRLNCEENENKSLLSKTIVSFHGKTPLSDDSEGLGGSDSSVNHSLIESVNSSYEKFWDSVLIDDDDSLEYDIVNIDHKLLEVRRFLSYETITPLKWEPQDYNRKCSILFPNSSCVSFLNIENDNFQKEKTRKEKYGCYGEDVCTVHISEEYPGCSGAVFRIGKIAVILYDVTTVETEPKIDDISLDEEVPQTQSIPKYNGPPNAFIIELFVIHEDYDERYGFDILEVAFELFSELDYCIITLPSSHVVFPLLEHFTYVPSRVCQCRCVSEVLYVAHRNSVCGDIRVRPGELGDLKSTHKLLSNITAFKCKFEVLTDIYTSSINKAFILESEGEPVGLAVVTPAISTVYKRTRYDLAKYRNTMYQELEEGMMGDQGNLFIMVMSPVLQPHANFFLREIFRFTRLTGLYWICEDVNSAESRLGNNVMSAIGEMIRVLPNRIIEYKGDIVKKTKVLQNAVKNLSPFAMWYSNPRLTALPKFEVNHSIVVIGASNTAMAFLEALIFGPSSTYLNFTNITLISHQGLQVVNDCLKAADDMLPHVDHYGDRYMKSVPFHFFVNIIDDFMIDINRKEKYVELVNGNVVYYDQLFLMCGIQFQHPDYLKDILEKKQENENERIFEYTTMDNPNHKDIDFQTKLFQPINLFLVNSILDANNSLLTLRKLINVKVNYNVVVYGATIHAYCCLYSLLELGIPPSCIVFVEPFPCHIQDNPNVSFFNNEYVDQIVNQNIEELGIRVYRKFYLAQGEVNWCTHSYSKLTTVKFISQNNYLELRCIGFFYFGTVGINIHTLNALHKSGIVYDGGVVINERFETSDSNIFAAGPITKYKRIFNLDLRRQTYYQSHEIGVLLGDITRMKLDPFMANEDESHDNHIQSNWDNNVIKIPTFSSPINVQAKFPGDLYYLNVSAPGQEIPLEALMQQDGLERVFITNKSGYFRLQFDNKKKISSITCLRKQPFEANNIRQLYGRHEHLLNNFMISFAAKKIDDLYEYFSQPWMYALYHAEFDYFLCDMQNVIPPEVQKHVETIKSEIQKEFKTSKRVDGAPFLSRASYLIHHDDLGYEEQIMAILIKWLSDHQETLPVYALNEFLRILYSEVYNGVNGT